MIQCIESTHQQFFTIAVICTIFQVIVFSSLYGSLEQIAEKGRRSIVFLMRMRGEARVTENGSVGSRVGSRGGRTRSRAAIIADVAFISLWRFA